MEESPSKAAEQWSSTTDDAVDAAAINEVLATIGDDLWVAAACIERILDDIELERKLLALGLAQTQKIAALAQDGVADEAAALEDEEDESLGLDASSVSQRPTAVATRYFATHETEARGCGIRARLLDMNDKLATYDALQKAHALSDTADTADVDLDPWADADDASIDEFVEAAVISLSQFISQSLQDSALQLAAASKYSAVQILLERHPKELWPYRFAVLRAVPEHVHPSDYLELLPRLDSSFELEARFPDAQSPRPLEWCESTEVVAAIQASGFPLDNSHASDQDGAVIEPLSAAQLSGWYCERALGIERTSGLVDVALAFIQHGASQGIPGLDELGEELSLLERLVYDAPQSAEERVVADWSLQQWRQLAPLAVVRAYLAQSTPANIANAIRSLVMPYLYVLEARAERAGSPDPGLPNRLLTEYLLEAPLPLLAAVFDASKPTLPTAQRILKDDAHMARLALACLYGSDSLYEWRTMSQIFECLPAWEGAQGAEEEDEADTTLASLGAFVMPSTTRPKCSSAELLLFFTPLPAFALSRALDVLDVHLDAGEILARWRVPAPLRWFLQSADDAKEQRAYATRMARRAGGGREDELENEDEWDALKDDMLKLATGGRGALKGPLGALQKEEVLRIFFGGLLSAGRFDIARSLLNPSEVQRPLEPHAVEELVLEASHEFYDNASSGNLHHGEMKLAYDCLSVAPQTVAIRKERDFIEATSRICSFNVRSRSGNPIAPIEIRLEKDRLSLIARVLASTDDAYKHSQVMLELANKLGVPGDARVYGMLADAALAAEDFAAADAASAKMVASVHTPEDAEVAWRTAYQLGRQAEWDDLEARLRLLGHAARLCPPEYTLDVLTNWKRVEKEHLDARKAAPRRVGSRTTPRKRQDATDRVGTAFTSLTARLQGIHVPGSPATSDAAARAIVAGGHRAAATLSRVAGAFPTFGGGGHTRSGSDEAQQRSGTPDLSNAAKHAFSRGVGWLIGDD
ncbi:hypothetical protein EXIGLDRAFT_705207 [Exidia glandulosa HHB12029]|uniref:Sec39 domain-containing protein n=1 Tax=Exidia glandulosa HHB12029 TaxID=1314781 RepID=A0A165PRF6_EXIGL|nr:hypothetical protein EXIGLDRAFT_705207 [Exidia glandulosa HHB12029]